MKFSKEGKLNGQFTFSCFSKFQKKKFMIQLQFIIYLTEHNNIGKCLQFITNLYLSMVYTNVLNTVFGTIIFLKN